MYSVLIVGTSIYLLPKNVSLKLRSFRFTFIVGTGFILVSLGDYVSSRRFNKTVINQVFNLDFSVWKSVILGIGYFVPRRHICIP